MFMAKVTYKTKDQLYFYIKGSKLFLILRLSEVLALFPEKRRKIRTKLNFCFPKESH